MAKITTSTSLSRLKADEQQCTLFSAPFFCFLCSASEAAPPRPRTAPSRPVPPVPDAAIISAPNTGRTAPRRSRSRPRRHFGCLTRYVTTDRTERKHAETALAALSACEKGPTTHKQDKSGWGVMPRSLGPIRRLIWLIRMLRRGLCFLMAGLLTAPVFAGDTPDYRDDSSPRRQQERQQHVIERQQRPMQMEQRNNERQRQTNQRRLELQPTWHERRQRYENMWDD